MEISENMFPVRTVESTHLMYMLELIYFPGLIIEGDTQLFFYSTIETLRNFHLVYCFQFNLVVHYVT